MSNTFNDKPSLMDKARFVAVFGGVYEHSPWIAEAAYDDVVSSQADTVDALSQCLQAVLAGATQTQKLALINAHPDLAGKAAIEGKLTAESTAEQSGAGIDQCSHDEFTRFQALNEAYKAAFKFPFIKAVKGSNRHIILEAFESRITNDWETEFHAALNEINKIARFRLIDIASTSV